MTAQPAHPTYGVALVLGAALLWGTTGTAQSLAGGELDSLWVGALRLVVAAGFFALLLAGTAGGQHLRLNWRGLPMPLLVAAALCMTLYNLCFFAGVRATGVAVGTAMALGSGPVWAALIEVLWQRRRPPWAWWLGTVMAVAGVALLVLAPAATAHTAAHTSALGVLLCLAAGLAYAVYALLNKTLVSQVNALPGTACVFVLAAVLALPLAALGAGAPVLRGPDVAVLLWLGVMSTGVAYLLLSQALRHIAGSTAVSLALAEPVTAFVLALVVVGERPPLLAWCGLAVVLVGLLVVVRAEVAQTAPARRLS